MFKPAAFVVVLKDVVQRIQGDLLAEMEKYS